MKNSLQIKPELSDQEFDRMVENATRPLNGGYMLSEAAEATIPIRGGVFDLTVCERLARLSHSLSDSAIRLFIHLWAFQLKDLSQAICISTRDLAAVAGISKTSVRAALDQLYSRGAIVLRWGNNTRPNRIYCCLWEGSVIEMGGSKSDPPSPRESRNVGQNLTHLPPEMQGRIFASGRERADSDSDPITDIRSTGKILINQNSPAGTHPAIAAVSAANPQLVEPARLVEAAQILNEAMRRRGERVMAPPDDLVVAQFLACGEWAELNRVVMRIIQSNVRIRKYGYFVSAALEQIHGIKPGDFHQARTSSPRPALVPRSVPLPPPAPSIPSSPPPNTLENMAAEWGLTVAQMEAYLELEKESPPQTGGDVLRLIERVRSQSA